MELSAFCCSTFTLFFVGRVRIFGNELVLVVEQRSIKLCRSYSSLSIAERDIAESTMSIILETWPPDTEDFAAVLEKLMHVVFISSRRVVRHIKSQTSTRFHSN